jgi:hypothetical protein
MTFEVFVCGRCGGVCVAIWSLVVPVVLVVSLFSCGGGSGYNYRVRVWWSSSVFLLHVNFLECSKIYFPGMYGNVCGNN